MTLPDGWIETTIADVTTVNPKHDSDTDREQSVSFVPMSAVDEHLGVIIEPVDRMLDEIWKGFTHFAEGDVIFAKITPCMENGKAAVARGLTNGLACGSTEFYVLRPDADIQADYLWRYLRQRSYRSDAERHMTGAVGQRRVPKQYLESSPLPLPPAAEQRRIVARLDVLSARLARARAELDRVLVLVDALRRKALDDLWAFPSDCSLEELLAAPIRNGLSVKGSEQPPGVPALKLSALRGAYVDLDDVRFLPISAEKAASYRLVDNDLLVSRGNGTLSLVGRASLVEGRDEDELPIFPDTAFRLRVDARKALSRWLVYVWNSPQMRKQVEAAARTTAGIWKIAQRDLIAFRLPRTNLNDQQALVEHFDAAFARADRLEAEAARALKLIDRLEAAILAKAFRGELVPQDPNDEPASVLLERIRAVPAAALKPKRGRRANGTPDA